MNMRDLLVFDPGRQHYFVDLLPMLYPSLRFLTFPSSLAFAPVGLGLPFLIALFWHHFLQPFSLFVDECDIEGGLFVRGLPLFWDFIKTLRCKFINYLKMSKENTYHNSQSVGEIMSGYLFFPLGLMIASFVTHRPFRWRHDRNECMIDDA